MCMSESENVLFETSESGIATITVDRPEKRNAIDVSTRVELRETFERAAHDDDVRSLSFGGAVKNPTSPAPTSHRPSTSTT